MTLTQPGRPRKGRGATHNPANRFAPTHSEAVDDGWWQEAMPERIATSVRDEPAKSALSWNRSPDLAFDRSLNPYRGCEHGCIYCYARPSHAYWDLSPGIDFETRLIARSGLVERLRDELCRPGYVCRPSTCRATPTATSRWRRNAAPRAACSNCCWNAATR